MNDDQFRLMSQIEQAWRWSPQVDEYDLSSAHFVYGPGMARFQDHNYAIYAAAGFIGADLDWVYNTIFNFIVLKRPRASSRI